MYAVVKTGGKQYRVSMGDQLRVEKLPGAVGDEVTLEEVLMLGGNDKVVVGQPKVDGASVKAKILEQDRARKVIVYKFLKRKDHHKKQGHRQAFTRIQIMDIQV